MAGQSGFFYRWRQYLCSATSEPDIHQPEPRDRLIFPRLTFNAKQLRFIYSQALKHGYLRSEFLAEFHFQSYSWNGR